MERRKTERKELSYCRSGEFWWNDGPRKQGVREKCKDGEIWLQGFVGTSSSVGSPVMVPVV